MKQRINLSESYLNSVVKQVLNEAYSYYNGLQGELPDGYYVCVDTDYGSGNVIAYIGDKDDATEAQNSSEGHVFGPFSTPEEAQEAAASEGYVVEDY
jgi:hypothetical protein